MATEGRGKETNEIKTHFTTREGLYRLLPHSEYSRPNRVPFNSQGSNPVRVSFVNLNDQTDGKFLACVSQDGFLRVFNFDSAELHDQL